MRQNSAFSKQKRIRQMGLLLYLLGLLLGITLAGLAVWGDLEASLFDVLFRAEQRLTNFSCPIIMTRAEETAVVRVSLKNTGERDENLLVRARITDGFITVIREERTNLTLVPNQEERLFWEIAPEDAAWNRIILIRVGTVRNAPFRRLVGAACGVLLLPIDGMTGSQVVTSMLILGTVLVGAGGWLWGVGRISISPKDKNTLRLLLAFLVITVMALLFGFLQLWGLGLVTIIVFVVLLGSTIEQFARL